MKFFISVLLLLGSLQALTIEEKVGQLLMVHFYGNEVNKEAQKLIKEAHVGSFIYYSWANDLTKPEKVKKLSQDLQDLSAIALIIAVDQEGGLVTRLTEGFTAFPGNAALGKADSPDLAEKAALYMGQELKAVGINMNLAPVVDINSNPKNPIIGIRSFGSSPETVIPLAESTLKGYKKAGILTSLKHFPGHGDVSIDPHKALPIVLKTKDDLMKLELSPFFALKDQTDTIMTAHILLPLIDKKFCATLSHEIITNLLKRDLGYQGVVISDSLVMEGLLKNCQSLQEGALMAFQAGCDILLLGGKQLNGQGAEATCDEVLKVHAFLVEAVKSGKISEERVDQSVAKILKLKEKISPTTETIDFQEHQNLAKQIAQKATSLIKKEPFDLKEKKILVVAPKIMRHAIEKSQIGNKRSFFYETKIVSPKEIKKIKNLSKKADITFFFSYNAAENTNQVEIFQAIDCKTITVCLSDPQDAALFSKSVAILTTLSPTLPSIEAALSLCLQ